MNDIQVFDLGKQWIMVLFIDRGNVVGGLVKED